MSSYFSMNARAMHTESNMSKVPPKKQVVHTKGKCLNYVTPIVDFLLYNRHICLWVVDELACITRNNDYWLLPGKATRSRSRFWFLSLESLLSLIFVVVVVVVDDSPSDLGGWWQQAVLSIHVTKCQAKARNNICPWSPSRRWRETRFWAKS